MGYNLSAAHHKDGEAANENKNANKLLQMSSRVGFGGANLLKNPERRENMLLTQLMKFISLSSQDKFENVFMKYNIGKESEKVIIGVRILMKFKT